MLPSMPLLITPLKKNTDANRDSQNTVSTELTKDLFVNIAETEQHQTLMLFNPNAVPQSSNTALTSTFSPSSMEVSSIINKKYVSPRQAKQTTLHRTIDFTGKKENQLISTLESLLIPVNHSITVDTEMKSSTTVTAVGQDVEMTEVGVVPDIEKLNVDVGQSAENHSLSSPLQHHKVDVKEGGVKGKTPSSVSARRSKKQRELEATIAALKPETAQMKEERATSYAQTYFMKVKERLEDAAYAEFVQELVNFKDNNNMDAASLYTRMTALLSPHKDLIDEFLAFLLPDQAKQVGRLMDYILLVKMKDFINKLEVLLTKQSQQVYTSLEQLASQANVSLTDVHNAILPHLKSSPLLTDYFLELLPGERPPDSLMIDYEQADCIEGDEDICYEMIQVPDFEDLYGGEHCPCKCHKTQGFHCITCGIKYINGRVYLQHGKIIRSAKVTFEKEDQEKMLKLKWRGRGEPEISYSRYHHRRFPTPVKASHHRESTKKSPRTPRAKTGNGSKPRNYKSASTKGSCSIKGLPLIEGITPLLNKLEFNDCAETEVRSSGEIEKEIKSFGGNEISADEQLKNVQVGDHQQRSIQNSPKEIVRLTQGLIKAVQEDSDNMDEDMMMSIEEEETKSPTCSQIAEIPSIISPMSFYSESLHSESGFEFINTYSTNTLRYEDTVLQPSSPLTLLNSKSPLLETNEKEIETMQVTDIKMDTNNDNLTNLCSKGIGLVSRATMESVCSEKMYFSDIKESQIGNELVLKKDVDYTIENHRLSFVDSDIKAIVNFRKHEGEIISEPRDESMTVCGSNSEHVSYYVDIETNEEKTSGNATGVCLNSKNPDETLNDCATSNLEQKSNLDSKVKLQSCYFLSTEQKKEESVLKIESRKSSIIIEEKKDIVVSESEVLDQKKTVIDCASHSSMVTEQKKEMTTPELPCWTREEDKIILQAFQQEGDSEQTFRKINQLLPTRTVREIQNRFQVLLQLLQQMTGVVEDSGR